MIAVIVDVIACVMKANAEKTSQIKPLEQEMAINQLEQQEIK